MAKIHPPPSWPLALALGLLGPGAIAQEVAGTVKTCKGEVQLVRGTGRQPVEVGTRLQEKDVLVTGRDGTVGVILRDDTTLSLGPSSEVVLKAYTFRPKEGAFASVTRLVKGTLVFLTGRISRLSPGSVQVETPVGVVAVRGTKLLVSVEE